MKSGILRSPCLRLLLAFPSANTLRAMRIPLALIQSTGMIEIPNHKATFPFRWVGLLLVIRGRMINDSHGFNRKFAGGHKNP